MTLKILQMIEDGVLLIIPAVVELTIIISIPSIPVDGSRDDIGNNRRMQLDLEWRTPAATPEKIRQRSGPVKLEQSVMLWRTLLMLMDTSTGRSWITALPDGC